MRKWLAGILSPKSDDLSQSDVDFVLDYAIIPEHIPSLMTSISNGKPFFKNGHLGFLMDDRAILVGYPVHAQFSVPVLETVLNWLEASFSISSLWLIAPELPPVLRNAAVLIQSDQYFQLDLEKFVLTSALGRIIRKTETTLRVTVSKKFSDQHRELIAEFLDLQTLPPLVEALYQNLPVYLDASETVCLLNAWDHQGRLAAFYAMDRAARHFDTYIIGCYSRENYTAHASDRLFWEMIELARKNGKTVLQLGLGVNPGIRKFKEKWGGRPFLDYHAWECQFGSEIQKGLIAWISEGKW